MVEKDTFRKCKRREKKEETKVEKFTKFGNKIK